MKVLLLLVGVLSLAAHAETATLLTRASSKMPTGTPFTVRSNATGKIYRGVLITQKARNFFRRGSLVLRFDDPVRTTVGEEGVFRASHKKQILVLAGLFLASKLADDLVDRSIGTGRARFVGAAAALGVMLFTNGGNVNLRPGYQLELEAAR
jgi:hypothetical protein